MVGEVFKDRIYGNDDVSQSGGACLAEPRDSVCRLLLHNVRPALRAHPKQQRHSRLLRRALGCLQLMKGLLAKCYEPDKKTFRMLPAIICI